MDSPTITNGETSVSNTVTYVPGKITHSYVTCDGEVRWNNGVLEQAWTIIAHFAFNEGLYSSEDGNMANPHESRPLPMNRKEGEE